MILYEKYINLVFIFSPEKFNTLYILLSTFQEVIPLIFDQKHHNPKRKKLTVTNDKPKRTDNKAHEIESCSVNQ